MQENISNIASKCLKNIEIYKIFDEYSGFSQNGVQELCVFVAKCIFVCGIIY